MAKNSLWTLQFHEKKNGSHVAHDSIKIEPLPLPNRSTRDIVFVSAGDITIEKNGDKISLTRTGIVGKNGNAFDLLPCELIDVAKLLLQFDIEQKINFKK